MDEWFATGEAYVIEGLEPGVYYLEMNDDENSRVQLTVKEIAKPQSTVTYVWTLWDTILVITGAVSVGLAAFIIIHLVRRRRKKRSHEQ